MAVSRVVLPGSLIHCRFLAILFSTVSGICPDAVLLFGCSDTFCLLTQPLSKLLDL